jgi:hypothetical protein
MANKPEEFRELYHSIIPDAAAKEHLPVLVHGSKRLVDHAVIVVSSGKAGVGCLVRGCARTTGM